MTSSVDVTGTPAQAPAARRDDRPPHGGQERWLFELEQAMLAQETKKPPAVSAARAEAAPALPAPARQMEARDAVPAVVATGAIATGMLARGAVMVGQPDVYALYTDMVTSDTAASPAPLAITPVALAGASLASAGALQTQTPGAVLAETVCMAVPARVGLGLGQAAAMTAALPSDSEVATVPAPRAATDNGAHYAQSQMHLYRGSDGVHASIRDAALSDTQGLLVMQAMALELAGAGATLKSMTVNGKEMRMRQTMAAVADGFVDEQALSGAYEHQFMTKEAI